MRPSASPPNVGVSPGRLCVTQSARRYASSMLSRARAASVGDGLRTGSSSRRSASGLSSAIGGTLCCGRRTRAGRSCSEGGYRPRLMRDVPIRDDTIRLGQLLKLAGLADSGGEANELLAEGAVTVNGEPEERRGRQLRSGDVVAVGEEQVRVA